MTELTREQRLDRRKRTREFLDNQENVDDLIEWLSEGNNLRAFCVANNYVYATIQAHMSEGPAQAQYRAAKLIRAEIVMAEIEELEELLKHETDKVLSRGLESLIKSKQWRIAKLNPADYSDRSIIDNRNWDMTKLHLDALRRVTSLPRRPEALPIIASTELPAIEPSTREPAVDAEFTETTSPKEGTAHGN